MFDIDGTRLSLTYLAAAPAYISPTLSFFLTFFFQPSLVFFPYARAASNSLRLSFLLFRELCCVAFFLLMFRSFVPLFYFFSFFFICYRGIRENRAGDDGKKVLP